MNSLVVCQRPGCRLVANSLDTCVLAIVAWLLLAAMPRHDRMQLVVAYRLQADREVAIC